MIKAVYYLLRRKQEVRIEVRLTHAGDQILKIHVLYNRTNYLQSFSIQFRFTSYLQLFSIHPIFIDRIWLRENNVKLLRKRWRTNSHWCISRAFLPIKDRETGNIPYENVASISNTLWQLKTSLLLRFGVKAMAKQSAMHAEMWIVFANADECHETLSNSKLRFPYFLHPKWSMEFLLFFIMYSKWKTRGAKYKLPRNRQIPPIPFKSLQWHNKSETGWTWANIFFIFIGGV